MQPALSPKKYIETRARTLPIYKCLVNPDWKEAGIADVVVMRQHVNGNVTGAVYLVDLKCLGVKDSFWFFNEKEAERMEHFPKSRFVEIDYTLAHNIVYAGYEFALEYGIPPQKDFAVAKYILKEDTDDIPLIDIPTGEGEDGIPHLIEHNPGQYADALLKLKKNAGEGNYQYTAPIASHHLTNTDEEENDEDNNEEVSLSEIPDGGLTLRLAKDIPFLELANKELTAGRSETDRLICDVALQVRLYNYIGKTGYEEPAFIEEEWQQLPEDGFIDAKGLNEKIYDEGFRLFADMNEEIARQKLEPEQDASVVERYLRTDKGNPLFLSLVCEMTMFHRLPVSRELLNQALQPFAHLPIVQLLRAMESVVNGTDTGKWSYITEATNIRSAFPNMGLPGTDELMFFWALQIIHQLRLGNLPLAMSYFELYSEIDIVLIHTHLFFFILGEIMPAVSEAVAIASERIEKRMEDAAGAEL